MWQPNRAQWLVIWVVAILVILSWPGEGGSLAVKSVRWLADPRRELPAMPDPLPMGLGDDGDAVAEHDRQMQEYYAFYEGSVTNRWRLRLATADDPLAPSTQRQILTGLAVLAALGVWKLNGPAGRSSRSAGP